MIIIGLYTNITYYSGPQPKPWHSQAEPLLIANLRQLLSLDVCLLG